MKESPSRSVLVLYIIDFVLGLELSSLGLLSAERGLPSCMNKVGQFCCCGVTLANLIA